MQRLADRLGGPLTGTITGVSTRKPAIALTFDDGPDPVWTKQLLEILEAHAAKATFFMLGTNAQRYPELVQAVAAAGHAIGNHSWDHPSFPLISSAERRRQLEKCAQALGEHDSRLFRPPYGHQSLSSRWDVRKAGYRVVTWNVVEPDWLNRSADVIAAGIMDRVRAGSIVLLHDALFDAAQLQYDNREQTIKVVDMLLTRLQQFQFVSVPELLKLGRARMHFWLRKADADLLRRLQMVGFSRCNEA